METIVKAWCVRYVSADDRLLNRVFIGSLEDCARFVAPKCHGSYVILPYEK